MTDQRIDSIARAAAGLDRRGLVKTLGAAALGAAGLLAVRGAAGAEASTENKLEDCRDRCRTQKCVDVANPNRCLRRCKDQCEKRFR